MILAREVEMVSIPRSTEYSLMDKSATNPGDENPRLSLDREALAMITSQFYPDTAPRSIWRPQLDAWVRKHPSKLKELSTTQARIQKSAQLVSSPNYSLTNALKLTVLTDTSSACSSIVSPTNVSSTNNSNNTYKAAAGRSSSSSSSSDGETSENSPLLPTNLDKFKRQSTKFDETAVKLPSPPQSPQLGLGIKTLNTHAKRKCISCGSGQSPCWRPSWSLSAGQLCNSCGLRYKKTGARCLAANCGRIPAKCEWATMQETATVHPTTGHPQYSCLTCGGDVEVRQCAG